jgi:hypothetical protein
MRLSLEVWRAAAPGSCVYLLLGKLETDRSLDRSLHLDVGRIGRVITSYVDKFTMSIIGYKEVSVLKLES